MNTYKQREIVSTERDEGSLTDKEGLEAGLTETAKEESSQERVRATLQKRVIFATRMNIHLRIHGYHGRSFADMKTRKILGFPGVKTGQSFTEGCKKFPTKYPKPKNKREEDGKDFRKGPGNLARRGEVGSAPE